MRGICNWQMPSRWCSWSPFLPVTDRNLYPTWGDKSLHRIWRQCLTLARSPPANRSGTTLRTCKGTRSSILYIYMYLYDIYIYIYKKPLLRVTLEVVLLNPSSARWQKYLNRQSSNPWPHRHELLWWPIDRAVRYWFTLILRRILPTMGEFICTNKRHNGKRAMNNRSVRCRLSVRKREWI